MTIRSTVGSALLLLPALFTGIPQQSREGVLVEDVTKNFDGERAGFHPGDVILHWTRGDASGDIDSPFDFFQLEIEQKPRGTVLLDGRRGNEKQTWTPGPGSWGLRVRPQLNDSLLAAYRACQVLSQAGSPPQTSEPCRTDPEINGPVWFRSWFALQAAEALVDSRQWNDADKAYAQALQIAGGDEPATAAVILNRWAIACENRGDLDNAARHYQDSLLKYEEVSAESLAVATNLNGLGSVGRKRGDLKNAEDYSRRALAIEEKLVPGSLEVGVSLNNLGNIAWAHRDLATANQYHRRALDIRQRLAPGSLAMAASLNNLGLIAWQRQELDLAEQYQLQALAIRQQLAPGSPDVASSFINLGNIEWDRGDLAKAEKYYRQALQIREQLTPNSLELATILNNLGLVAWRRGELSQAEQYDRRALAIQQKQADATLDLANSFHNLANVLRDQGKWIVADECESKALEIRRALSPNSIEVASSLNNLGFSAVERGDYDAAEKYSRQALDIESKLASEHLLTAQSLYQLGEVAQERGDLARAEGFYRQALGIQERLSPGSKSHAQTLAALGRTMRRIGKLEDAAALFDRALQAIESQSARLGGIEEARYVFRAGYAEYYAEYIDLLFTQKQYAMAFQVAERSRAQLFLELLNAARVNVDKDIDPALLARKRRLEQAISSKSSDRIELFNGKHTQEQETKLTQEMEKLLDEYQQLEDEVRAASPGYTDLTQPRSLAAKQVQEGLLDPNTLLLEYSLGQAHSYLWMISQTSLYAYELPGRSTIEAAARQAYKLLIAPPPQNSAELHRQHAKWNLAAARLSRMVLAPVAAQLAEKRLLLVTDGALQYIPFEALPLSGIASPDAKAAPLVLKHEIVYLPSASTLDTLRRVHKTGQPGSRTVAVLADPVFDKDDVRVRLKSVAQNTTTPQLRVEEDDLELFTEQLSRSVADSGLGRLPRLSYTRREADAILATIPAGQGAEFLDFDASRNTATGLDLAQFRMIHFATHGLLNSKHPELSGLVLSLVDPQGKSQNGFLGLQDIYNLKLHADLVVLSACETALGKEVRGEGLIGISRGFMYAGANRLLASLWKVDDVATAELMARFYRHMEQEGSSPAAALRLAQIEMSKQKRWTVPYYWAGFELQGEWR